MIKLLTTKGNWYDLISSKVKKFDFRAGYREASYGDVVVFVEAEVDGTPTGNECTGRINYVLHSKDFPSHFGWDGEQFTIIQFEIKEWWPKK